MKQLPLWGKAAIAVLLALLSYAGLKKPVVDSICSSYHVDEKEIVIPGAPVGEAK